MNREKRIQEEVEKTLQALDQLPRLQGNPYLYTRFKAALAGSAQDHEPVFSKTVNVRSLALSLLVVLNVVTAIYFFSTPRPDVLKEELISTLSSEYSYQQNSF